MTWKCAERFGVPAIVMDKNPVFLFKNAYGLHPTSTTELTLPAVKVHPHADHRNAEHLPTCRQGHFNATVVGIDETRGDIVVPKHLNQSNILRFHTLGLGRVRCLTGFFTLPS